MFIWLNLNLKNIDNRSKEVEFVMKRIFICFTFTFLGYQYSSASTLIDFESSTGNISDGIQHWEYRSPYQNPVGYFDKVGGFFSDASIQSERVMFYPYINGYNTDHMGWGNYGYFDVDMTGFTSGQSSGQFIVTGGAYDNNGAVAYDGIQNYSKEDYDILIEKGISPVSTSERILKGSPSFYFIINENSYGKFESMQGADQFSTWIYHPKGLKHGSSSRPDITYSWYPFLDRANGGHYYHHSSNIALGGWTKIVFDAHPQHHNSGNHQSNGGYRVGGTDAPGDGLDYFKRVAKFAVRFSPPNAPAPWKLNMDNFEFIKSDGFQNMETIAGIGVGHDPVSKIFDISFNDKYYCGACTATYEVRYSFNPISNINFKSAKLVTIVQDETLNFTYTNGVKGQIKKPSNGYANIWALFNIDESDKDKLNIGAKIYFAVKDLSVRTYSGVDAYDSEEINVPGLGNIQRQRLIKSIEYSFHTPPKDLYIEPRILSSTLMDGFIGESYEASVLSKGNELPLSWSFVSGRLPLGLHFENSNGTISGTPRQKGTFVFNVKTRDALEHESAVQSVTLVVYDSPELIARFTSPIDYSDFGFTDVFSDSYTDLVTVDDHTGFSQTVGASGSYNYQGVKGTKYLFKTGDKIIFTWYNAALTNSIFKPKFSKTYQGRPDNSVSDWQTLDEINIPPKSLAKSYYTFTDQTAGEYELINISNNHNSNKTILCEKIEFSKHVQNENASSSEVDEVNIPLPPKNLKMILIPLGAQ